MAPARPASVTSRGRPPTWEFADTSMFPADDSIGEIDDQMDSMSAQLQNLINEGQKALGREIVVNMDGPCADEELEDDGDQGWGDDTNYATGSEVSRLGGLKSRRSRRTSPSKDGQRTHSPSSTPSLYRSNSRASSRAGTLSRQNSLPHYPETTAHIGVVGFDDAGFPSLSKDSGVELRVAMDKVRKAYGLDSQ